MAVSFAIAGLVCAPGTIERAAVPDKVCQFSVVPDVCLQTREKAREAIPSVLFFGAAGVLGTAFGLRDIAKRRDARKSEAA